MITYTAQHPTVRDTADLYHPLWDMSLCHRYLPGTVQAILYGWSASAQFALRPLLQCRLWRRWTAGRAVSEREQSQKRRC